MHTIRAFTMTDGNGFHIDLVGHGLAYSIGPNEGDVLINIPGFRACIPGKDMVRFELNNRGERYVVAAVFNASKGEDMMVLGIIRDIESAQAWIDRVNKLYSPAFRDERRSVYLKNGLNIAPLNPKEIKALTKAGIMTFEDLLGCNHARLAALKDCNTDRILHTKELVKMSL